LLDSNQSSDAKAARRILFASMIGTTIEFYDFYIYATAAVLVFPKLFFPKGDPATATLQSLATFALAFVARPIGSAIFGHFGDPIIRSIMVVSMLSCLNANQLFCTRTLYAMSCDRLFFQRAARVNAGGTPTVALLLSTLVGVLFVLGSFERVIAMLSFFFVANYTLSYTSLFVLRKKEPQMERPYRAWGYPWTTGIALLVSVIFLVGSIVTDQKNAPWALATLVLSFPVFLVMKRMTPPAAAE